MTEELVIKIATLLGSGTGGAVAFIVWWQQREQTKWLRSIDRRLCRVQQIVGDVEDDERDTLPPPMLPPRRTPPRGVRVSPSQRRLRSHSEED